MKPLRSCDSLAFARSFSSHLGFRNRARTVSSVEAMGFYEARVDFDRRYLRATLARAGGSRKIAAAQLGLTRQGFTKMLKRLGIDDGEIAPQ